MMKGASPQTLRQVADTLTEFGMSITQTTDEGTVSFDTRGGFSFVLVLEEPMFALYVADPNGEESDPDPIAQGRLFTHTFNNALRRIA